MTEALNEIPGGLWTLGAAFLTVLGSVAVAVTPRWLEGRERIRQRYAVSTEIIAAWIELPYRIARRTSDDSKALQALAELGHDLQERSAKVQAWVAADNRTLGNLYLGVLTSARRRCGEAAQEAWERPFVAKPEDMNVGVLISEQPELDSLVSAWTCVGGMRVGWSRVLLWIPKPVLLKGRWNHCARLASQVKGLEQEKDKLQGDVL